MGPRSLRTDAPAICRLHKGWQRSAQPAAGQAQEEITMAQIQIQPDDVIATLEAQRNEAWNVAAKTGAALQYANRRIDELEKELQAAHKQIEDMRVANSDIPPLTNDQVSACVEHIADQMAAIRDHIPYGNRLPK